jgi:N-acetylmuramoyl-L-alanine amidase
MKIKIKLYAKAAFLVTIAAMLISGCASQGPYLKLDTALQKEIRTFDGAQYLPLTRLCDAYGVQWKWDPYIKTATIQKKGTIVLRSGSDRVLVNGVARKLDRPVMMDGGTVFVPVSFAKTSLGSIVPVSAKTAPAYITEEFPPVTVSGARRVRTVIIDAGHGGNDPGAIGKRLALKEKDTTLYIAKRLKNILEENGIKVILTRSNDTFISLAKRVEITNNSVADIFVSVHINAARSTSMSGFECYYLSEATDDNARALEAAENVSVKAETGTLAERSKGLDKTLWDMQLTENRRESIELAKFMCGSVDKSLAMRNRGIRSARFYVLKGSRIPAVLAEVGYISNRLEEQKLKTSGYLDRMADVLAQGILSYKNEYERTNGFTT